MGNSLLDITRVRSPMRRSQFKDDIPERGAVTLNNLNQFRKNRPATLEKSPAFFPVASKMKLEFGKPETEVETSSSSETSGVYEPPDPFAR